MVKSDFPFWKGVALGGRACGDRQVSSSNPKVGKELSRLMDEVLANMYTLEPYYLSQILNFTFFL